MGVKLIRVIADRVRSTGLQPEEGSTEGITKKGSGPFLIAATTGWCVLLAGLMVSGFPFYMVTLPAVVDTVLGLSMPLGAAWAVIYLLFKALSYNQDIRPAGCLLLAWLAVSAAGTIYVLFIR